MNERLKSLYKSVILEHDKNPFNYEKREGATVELKAYNPFCGDKFKLYLEIEEDQIKNCAFHGYGCSISKASTSILLKNIIGKSTFEARQLILDFERILAGNTTEDDDEELTAFQAAKSFPGREKCATLSWDELSKFLSEQTT